jgi:hypothetical protein
MDVWDMVDKEDNARITQKGGEADGWWVMRRQMLLLIRKKKKKKNQTQPQLWETIKI